MKKKVGSDVNAMNHILGAGVPSPRLKLPIMQAAEPHRVVTSFFQFTSHFHHFHKFSSFLSSSLSAFSLAFSFLLSVDVSFTLSLSFPDFLSL